MSALRSISRKLLALGFGLLVALLVCEVALRLLGISDESIGTMDPIRGWALHPHSRALKQVEGRGLVEVNSQGLRDREHAFEKPADAYRIALLGDSFTAGEGVEREQSYAAVLEAALRSCPALAGRQPEVINFGVTAYGTTQELLTFRHHARAYDPDLVVVGIFTGNDISNNVRSLYRMSTAPYYQLVDGELVLDDSFRSSREYRWNRISYFVLRRSRVAQLVKRSVKSLLSGGPRRQRSAEQELLRETEAKLYRPDADADWAEAWQVTEAVLAQLNREVLESGASFVAVTLSNPIQVHPDPELRARLQGQLGIDAPFHPDDWVAAVGAEHGFEVVNLAREMRDAAEAQGIFYHGFENTFDGVGHWNAAGHRFAGLRLAERFCARISDGHARSAAGGAPPAAAAAPALN